MYFMSLNRSVEAFLMNKVFQANVGGNGGSGNNFDFRFNPNSTFAIF